MRMWEYLASSKEISLIWKSKGITSTWWGSLTSKRQQSLLQDECVAHKGQTNYFLWKGFPVSFLKYEGRRERQLGSPKGASLLPACHGDPTSLTSSRKSSFRHLFCSDPGDIGWESQNRETQSPQDGLWSPLWHVVYLSTSLWYLLWFRIRNHSNSNRKFLWNRKCRID